MKSDNEFPNRIESGERRPKRKLELAPSDDAATGAWSFRPGGYSLPELMGAVWRRRGVAAAVFVAVFAPAAAWLLTAPPAYEAEARLFVKRERMETPNTRGVADMQAPVTESEVASEIELIRSRELLRKLVEEHGLVVDESGSREARVERTVKNLEKKLRVGLIPGTSLISISYHDPDPKPAAEIVNTLARLYLAKHSELHRNPEALEFFSAQVERYRDEHESAQTELSKFMEANRLSLLTSQKEAKLRRIGQLEGLLQTVVTETQGQEEQAQLLLRQYQSLPETVRTSSRSSLNEPLIEQLTTLLVELENRRTEFLSRYEPSYRLVNEIERQIADTQAALYREQKATVVDQTESLNPMRQSIESDYLRTRAEIAGLRARRSEIRDELKTNRRRQARLEEITAEHDALTRRVNTAEDHFLLYQTQKEDARIAAALDRRNILNVSIVDSAVVPALPRDEYRYALALLSLLAALSAGIGAALALGRLNRPATSVAEIAALTGVPVLTTPAEFKTHVS